MSCLTTTSAQFKRTSNVSVSWNSHSCLYFLIFYHRLWIKVCLLLLSLFEALVSYRAHRYLLFRSLSYLNLDQNANPKFTTNKNLRVCNMEHPKPKSFIDIRFSVIKGSIPHTRKQSQNLICAKLISKKHSHLGESEEKRAILGGAGAGGTGGGVRRAHPNYS